MAFEQPPLPYEKDALSPHMSQETLEFHYGKHHAGYFTKLNKAADGTEWENVSLEDIVKKADGGVFNNGAQAWNHTFFWHCLSPKGGGEPKGDAAQAIEKNFGSFEAFKEQFSQAATTLFGSGWTWLSQKSDGGLIIENQSNAGNPLREGRKPILTLDMWEHAYYIDYRNDKPQFVNAFWQLINWDFINQNL